MPLRLTLFVLVVTLLTGCVGVIDRCTKGLDGPADGWTGRR